MVARGGNMNKNSENPRVGKAFQDLVIKRLKAMYHQNFYSEYALPIGNPPKLHRFDCVSEDETVVVECKCYTWTDSGNVPSAKLMGLNEAVFYMSYLPAGTTRILAINKSTHPRRAETLAEYYNRIDGHLLNGVTILEIDEYGLLRQIQ